MPERKTKPLRVITAPRIGSIFQAPPALMFSTHTVDYTCGRCETVLMHADEGQVHEIVIHCLSCGSYNATE